MTAIPSADGTGSRTFTLVCDGCGLDMSDVAVAMGDFALVWRLAVGVGWRGRAWPLGPHFCPECVATGRARSFEPEPGDR